MANSSDLKSLLGFLPELKDKTVLQLGSDKACTKLLADRCVKSLVVVDSNQESLTKNQTANANCSNVVYLKKSLKEVDTNHNQFDLIYSDSNFIDFSDERIQIAVEKSLKILNANGLLLIRESFDEKAMSPIKLVDLVQSKVIQENGTNFCYDIVFVKPKKALTLLQSETTQTEVTDDKMSFLFVKKQTSDFNGFNTLKDFMDNKQYTRNGVLRYEQIFGAGYVSTGGLITTEKFFKEFDLKKDQKVLDVGCGIGGGDFLLSKQFGVDVLAMDLSANMIGIAWERAVEHQDLNVQFEIGDIKLQKYPSNTFDMIYSRDTILHIDNKEQLFANFKDWLKPGGKVFITDYCCGPKPWSTHYAAYVASRGYSLLTPEEYGALFSKLGFKNVVAENVTPFFVEMLKLEKEKLTAMKEKFVAEFSEKDFDDLINGWNEKLVRCGEGHQVWGKISCEKE